MGHHQLIFLGTGTSTGVPVIGCKCAICQSSDPRNKRTRSSILIKTKAEKTILVDTSPDLRSQLLREKIDSMDFAFITHEHADHLHGIDDLRPFCFGIPGEKEPHSLPIYILKEHEQEIKNRFPYIFDRQNHYNKNSIIGGGTPIMHMETLEDSKLSIGEHDFEFFKLPHGGGITMGIFFEGLAYLIDCHNIPNNTIDSLKGRTDLLVIDCLRDKPHNTHLTVDQSFDFIEKIAPKKAYLVHMNHEMDHQALLKRASARFGSTVEPAFDGLSVSF